MHQLSSRLVIDCLEHARLKVSNPVIATDADGTLWSGDVGDECFEELLRTRSVRASALATLRAEALAHGVQADGDANTVALSILEAYRREAFPQDKVYELMAVAFAGYATGEVQAFAREVQRQTNLRGRLQQEMLEVLAWAWSSNVPVIVVSASPTLVVETALEAAGIRWERVIAATPTVVDGIVQGHLAEPMPYGEGKAAALARVAPNVNVIGAFGDSTFDMAMMRLAKVAAAVRPKPSLRQRAAEVPGLVELLSAS